MSGLESFKIATQLTTTPSDVIPAISSDINATVSACSFFNSNATAPRTITVYFIPPDGEPDASTEFAVIPISPRKSFDLLELINQVLPPGAKVQAKIDAGSDVNVFSSGRSVAT